MPDWMLNLIQSYGIPGSFALLATWIGYKLAGLVINDHQRLGKGYEELRNENLELRRERTAEHLDRLQLERKFTECREELAILKGTKELSDYKFLDDTGDLLNEMDNKTREILKLSDTIREHEETISTLQALLAQCRQSKSAAKTAQEDIKQDSFDTKEKE